MLVINEKEELPVKLEWFDHLPIYSEKDLPIELKEPNFSECTYYPNLKVEQRVLFEFEMLLLTSSFLQEVVTYDQNLFTDNFSFNTFFENENIEENIGKTKKLILIDCSLIHSRK